MFYFGNDPKRWYGDFCYACGENDYWCGKKCSIILCDSCSRKCKKSYFEELGWRISNMRDREKELTFCSDPAEFRKLIDRAQKVIEDYVNKRTITVWMMLVGIVRV